MALLAVRPGSWNLPLFLHVLGAMALFGGVLAAAIAGSAARRTHPDLLTRIALRATVFVALPAWVVMRLGAQWALSKEYPKKAPNWVDVGSVVSDAGLVLLLLLALVAWLSVRSGGAGRVAALVPGLASVYVAALVIAWWAMTTKPGLDWTVFWDLTVGGVTLGSVYALIALGYSMVYGILKLLNFAHGDVYMVGAFLGFFALQWVGGASSPTIAGWFAVIVMFAVAMAGCGALGVAIERFAYRPLRNAPRIAPLISALGVSIFLQNAMLLLFGAAFRDYTDQTTGKTLFSFNPYDIKNMIFVSKPQLLTIVLAILLMVGLTLLVARTRLGKAMRATAFDREAASMMGIDVDRVIASTFFIGSALAGAAGVMFGLVFGQIYHFMGFIAGLKGFTAAVVGGIGSIPGAMLGGLLVGLTESYATGYLPQGSAFKDFYVFIVLIVVILVRPSGLLGTADIKKV